MIIHNGDHMQYEIDNANVPKEQRSDWPLPSFDCRDWAKAFVERVKTDPAIATDEGAMMAWFASALMRGFDEHASRSNNGRE